MREILFKAKRADNGEWVTGYYIKSIVDGSVFGYIRESIFGTDIKIMLNTICQYTGLTDKNGNLIWENDVMVAHLDDRFPEDATYTRVVWNNNGFYTKEQGSDDIFPLDKFDQENFEVCGNLFDNPELMNE